ncbi:unnamed protein product [Calicophoron daubneyi]|uniref:Dendritic cell-specific transmembrane protein-like domain-containing protein n=1 Tax=Calicophoron daubneyi TaxID=300641 RepID=A0AAV2TB43_CALDB
MLSIYPFAENTVNSTIFYLEKLQRSYRCCGAVSIVDWLGVVPPNPVYEDKLFTSQNDFDPWHQTPVFLPASCCDSSLSPFCTPEALKKRTSELIRLPPRAHAKSIPVYPLGCVHEMTEYLKAELTWTTTSLLSLDILVNLIQVSTCFFAYHSQRPSKIYQLHSRVDQQNPVKSQNKSYRIFKGRHGYVTNERLLQVCQNFHLFARPSGIHNAFSKTKARWLNDGMKVGWMLRDRSNQYAEYIRRVSLKSKYRPGQIEWSGFRQFLRRRFPLMEAVIYADGDVLHESEGNANYYCLTTCVLRIVSFLIFGYIMSVILISSFVPKTPKDRPTASDEIGTQAAIRRDAEEVAKEVAWLSSVCIRTLVMAASVLSKRFRCLLLLLVPNLGLTVGQSYLGAELVHATLHGPGANIERNMRAAAETLRCLMDLAKNVTRDAKLFYESSQIDSDVSGAKTFFDTIKDKARALKQAIDRYMDSARNITQAIKSAAKVAHKAEKSLKQKDGGEKTEDSDDIEKEDKSLRDKLAGLTKEMALQEMNRTKAMAAESKNTVRRLMANVKTRSSALANLTRRIDLGASIENTLKKRLLATCMVFHNTRGMICLRSAVKACYRIQVILSTMFMLPIIVGPLCVRLVAKGVACPKAEAIQRAAEQCGSSGSRFGINPGFGAMFLQATDSLAGLSENFDLDLGVTLPKPPNVFSWIKGAKKSTILVTHRLKLAAQVMFYISLLLSSLMKLLGLLLLLKTNSYISKYLKDPTFDNCYVGQAFEAIDSKRYKEGRETLLPLKSFENKKVFWRRKGYTKKELLKAVITVIRAFGLGLIMGAFFFIDYYISLLIGLLDMASAGDIHIGKKGSYSPSSLVPPELRGDGIFYTLIKKTISILTKISKISLDYKLSACSPHAQITDIYYRRRFLIIWGLMILVGLMSGYLLRIRHIILDFFYPSRQTRRAVHLYNTLLADRRRHMTTCRNLIVHQVRQGRLQEDAQERSQQHLLYYTSPTLAKLLGKNKVQCLICRDNFKIGPHVHVCPYDDTYVCRFCLQTLFGGEEVCVVCMDRNPVELFEEQKRTQLLKEKFAFGFSGEP